ncbi:MAG: hypothetical protein A2Y17_11960 [Clostridiales bacterium GWF2_38_85]|nr:MAG: hypothetical protein A2Y17_11960 [Clostridiales bacterium GWF2_38_85]
MNKLGRLIKNELIKKFKAPSTTIVIAIFIVFCFALPFLSNINNYDYGYDRDISQMIQDLEWQIEAKGDYQPEVVKEQYKVEKAVYEKALEYNVTKINDWRFNTVEQIKQNAIIVFEAELVLDNDISEEEMSYLYNYSGYLGTEVSDDVLESLVEDTNNAIEQYWLTVENNDYMSYYKEQLKYAEGQDKQFDSQITAAELKLEQYPNNKEYKNTLNSLKDSKAYNEIFIKTLEFRIENDIEPSGSWENNTLDSIYSNAQNIISSKNELRLNEQEYNERYSYNQQSYEDFIKLTQNNLKKYEDKNLILWESLDNNTPDYTITQSTRQQSLSFLSLTMFVAIIAVFLASSMVSGEFSTKTINMLVIRPVKRWKIITAKYIAVLITGYITMFAGMAVCIISLGINYGFTDFIYPYMFVTGETVQSVSFFLYLAVQAMFCSISMIFLISVAFMMSTLTKNTALAVVSGIGLNIVFPLIYQIISYTVKNSVNWLKYTIIPYLDLSQFVGDGNMYNLSSVQLNPTLGAIMLGATALAMFVASLWTFVKRDIK